MTTNDASFAGSIPALYDRYLGPLIFEPYAADLARRLAALKPKRVLETAAGTGIVTQALARALPNAEIVATDLNQPMLDFAAAKIKSPRIIWRQADATKLPFDDKSFDAVVCQFGVMFFPDKGLAYREARRVLERHILKPNGRFVFNVWDRIEENEITHIVTQALAKLFPADPPLFMKRTPHGYHDVDKIKGELVDAGFRRVAVETVAYRSRAPSARDAVVGFCEGTPLRAEIEARGDLAAATQAATETVAARFGTGPIDAKIQAHVITATA